MKVNDIKKFERSNKIDLPKDTLSEYGVIGTILSHPEYILKSDYIKPNFFYQREMGCIYHIVNELFKKGVIEIDSFIVATEIERDKGFKSIFDNSELFDDFEGFMEEIISYGRSTVEEYELLCKNVVSSAFKRESYIKLEELQNGILTTEDDVNQLNYSLQQSITDFSKIYICNNEVKSLGEQADRIWEEIVGKRNNGFFGFPSKFDELNNYISYEKTELVLINAPKKTAKSQILSNEAWHKCISGVPTCYIDREMSSENHMVRFLSFLTGIESRDIKRGNLSIVEEKMVKEKIQYIKTLPFYHMYKPVADLNEMFMNIKSLQLKAGIEFLVYDYIKANSGADSDKEYQVLGRQTDWLKNEVSGTLNLATLGSAQLDDSGKKVADAQKIERNCSSSIHVIRKTMEEIARDGKDSGILKMMVKFNRNGSMTEDDEYINLHLNGGIATVEQAKNPFTRGVNPY